MEKNLKFSVLLDFYGEMLTAKQRDAIEYYYNDDLSLSEIAENQGITRQGARDSIKRAEALLYNMEKRLGLAKKFSQMFDELQKIKNSANSIKEYNKRFILSKEINNYANEIETVTEELFKLYLEKW